MHFNRLKAVLTVSIVWTAFFIISIVFWYKVVNFFVRIPLTWVIVIHFAWILVALLYEKIKSIRKKAKNRPFRTPESNV